MTTQAASDGREAEAFAKNTYRRIFLVMVVLLVAATPVLWVKYGRGMALSFIIGGLIALINFHWLKRSLAAMVDAIALAGKRRSPAGIILRFVLRYVLIGVALYAIFKSSAMSLYGLCAGLSLPVGAVLIEAAYAIYGALRRGL
ncbi:MAG TPA: ATP synthase subunit I [Candidatus Angelobacter sp.]|nr:ATP synthase subunit I [Candidatus Angelobacter sp.]